MATYSGKQFKVALGLHTSNLGIATVGGTMYYLRLDSISDIDFSGADVNAQLQRSGQRVLRPSDHITSVTSTNTGGGSWAWSFDNYVPENEALFQAMLTSIFENASTDGTEALTGSQSTNSYDYNVSNAYDLALQILSPDVDKGRYLYSAVMNSMTFSWDVGTNGGKLTTSGEMFSGYRPVIYDNSGITINSTAVASGGWNQNIFEMDAITIGGVTVVCKSFNLTVSNPAVRVGHKSITEASPGSTSAIFGQPESYSRGNQITVEGSMVVKMDDGTVGLVDNWLRGTTTAIVFGDHATIGSATCHLGIPTAKITGYNKDYAGEDGVWIEVPFIGTADGTDSILDYRIT